MSYTKLFSSILDSTIWLEDLHVKVVWITMLAMSDRDGVVEGSIPGLAKRAGVSIEQCEEALAKFHAPDRYSRSQDFEGRRVETIDGGWRLLNREKYAEKLDADDRREKDAARQQRKRERERSRSVTLRHAPSREVTTEEKSREEGDQDQNPHTLPEPPAPEPVERVEVETGEIGKKLAPGTVTADYLKPVTDRDEKRARLLRAAWNYGATKHAELQHGEGLSPTSPPWGLMPPATSPAVVEMRARIDELLVEDDFAAAENTIRRRVDVAAAVSRREGHLDWFTPMRMWDGKSFAIDSGLSPEQAARPRAARHGASSRVGAAEELPRRIKPL